MPSEFEKNMNEDNFNYPKPAIESDDEDVFEEMIRNTDDVLEQIKYYNLKSNSSFDEQCVNLMDVFSNDPDAFTDTDPKYICGVCCKKFSSVKVWPCQDISLCRQCLVNHFQNVGSITLAGLACPRCNTSVKWLTRGHINDEILNPPSGKHPYVALPYTFFFNHHDIYCRIYGCSGDHEHK